MLGMAFPKLLPWPRLETPLSRGSLGMEQPCGVEECVRGVSPCPRGHLWPLALCTMCVWAWETALLAETGVVRKSCTPARVTSLLLIFQPCFAAGWSSPSAKQQSPSQILDRLWLGMGRHPGVPMHREWTRDCVWLLCPTRAAGENCSFCASALWHWNENGRWQLLHCPSLLTKSWQESGTACHSLACHVLTQQLWGESSEGGMLHPAPSCWTELPLGRSLLLILCLIWNMCRFWSRKMKNEEH